MRTLSLASVITALALLALFGLTCLASPTTAQDSSWVKGSYRKGDFKLVYGGRAADILVSPDDFKVVRIAAEDLAADVERVTDLKPVVRAEASGL
ncbi:MAG TPA: hypothetical protein VEV81_06280, partial [Pyrinomonadaceae bacterium]|nr:hypothetical protein [Pyrinomonadaceae bacterium]